MQKNTSSQLSILLLLVSFLLLAFYTQPLRGTISAKEAELSALQTTMGTLQAKVEETKSMINKVEALSVSQKNQFRENIPVAFDEADLLEDVLAIARKQSIDITSITVNKGKQPLENGTYLTSLTISLLSPTQNDYISFLSGLENSLRLFRIRTIAMNYSAETFQTTLQIETYTF